MYRERGGERTYEVHDDLAVGVGLEDGGSFEMASEVEVVVDLSVDAEDELAVIRDQRLSTSVW
jgi:hypothetical protein